MSSTEPVRSCVVCRTRYPQGALVRVVRTPDGVVRVDAGIRRAAGRGAYVCSRERCLQKARAALARSLRTAVPEAVDEDLRAAHADRCAPPA